MDRFGSYQKVRQFYLPRAPLYLEGSEPNERALSDDVQLGYARLFGVGPNGPVEVGVTSLGSLQSTTPVKETIPFVYTTTLGAGLSSQYIVPNGGLTNIGFFSVTAQPVAVQVSYDGVTWSTTPGYNQVSTTAAIQIAGGVRGYQFTNNNVGASTIQVVGSYKIP